MIYLKKPSSLQLHTSKCIQCMRCVEVCPHGVFKVNDNIVSIHNIHACMECGGCQMNCPTSAIYVEKGVGCGSALIQNKLKKIKWLRPFIKDTCC